jgi:hypothetical protein
MKYPFAMLFHIDVRAFISDQEYLPGRHYAVTYQYIASAAIKNSYKRQQR